MAFKSIFRRSRPTDAARALYGSLATQARSPRFFTEFEVPDTLDGRFEMVALHAFLVLRRLKRSGDKASDLAQELFDVMFEDMDTTLREMGVGDMGVGKRVKTMVKAFYGRVAAYESGMATGTAGLAEALRRNAYVTAAPSEAAVLSLAGYVEAQAAHLAGLPSERIAAGEVSFLEAA